MKRVGWGLAVTCLVVAASTLGCQPGGAAAVATAADRTAEAGSFRVRISHQVVPADGAQAGGRTWSAEGAVDYRTGHAVLTLDVASEGPGELRLMGDRAFLRMTGVALGGRPWMELDLDGSHVPPGLQGIDLGGNDLRSLVDALGGAAAGVEKVGPATVAGEEMTRYHGSVDLSVAAERMEDSARRVDLLRRRTGLKRLGLEAWIDEEGRARRVVYYLPPSASAHSDAPTSTVAIELYDFGVAVEVEPPPASEVTVFGEPASD